MSYRTVLIKSTMKKENVPTFLPGAQSLGRPAASPT